MYKVFFKQEMGGKEMCATCETKEEALIVWDALNNAGHWMVNPRDCI